MGRRGENIHKRADGRWEARIVCGHPVGGRTNYKYLYGKSYQEVREKMRLFMKQQAFIPSTEVMASAKTMPVASLPLFEEVVYLWQESKRSFIKESSFSCYFVIIKNHLLPQLGKVPINQLSSQRIADFLALERQNPQKKKPGGQLSDKTMADIKSVLFQILSYAKKLEWIAAVPEFPVTPVRQVPIQVFSQKEQAKLTKIAREENTPHSLGVLLSLYGGIRIGEVCGLKWSAVDFENGTLLIDQTVYRIASTASDEKKTKVILGTPKTACSHRTIPLPDEVIRYLSQHRQDNHIYLTTGTEKFMEPRVCRERYKTLLRKAGIADRTYHALRHTFATRCIENGVDVKSLSEIMGHSNVQITMQRYVHPSMDMKKLQINKLPCFGLSGQDRGQKNSNFLG